VKVWLHKEEVVTRIFFGEIFFSLIAIFMIITPSFFLKFLSKVARFDYENKRSAFAELKKRDPSTYSFNERMALKMENVYPFKIGSRKDIYGPETKTQRWLMRIAGFWILLVVVLIFLQNNATHVLDGQ
jgi:hypothetical protein